jgi:predicted  nucleic acid-binding Zn-ribbon protein
MAQPPPHQMLRIGRGEEWSYNGAINLNEDAKVFYLYRGVLIVLVVALPHCTVFLGLTLGYLLQKTGTITVETFDKAVWLMCKAMSYLDSETVDTNYLNAGYIRDGGYNPGNNTIGFIRSFDDTVAKQGGGIHDVIAKSISRIVIRFLFAFSLNLRGMNIDDIPSQIQNSEMANPNVALNEIDRITQAIDEATRVQEEIEQQLPSIIAELNKALSEFSDEQDKRDFIIAQFAPITERLQRLGEKFNDKRADIERDISELTTQPGAQPGGVAVQQRISPRTFSTRLNTLNTSITRLGTDNIRNLTSQLQEQLENQRNHAALTELLSSAGNTFKGLQPIGQIPQIEQKNLHPRFVPRLLEKALVLQANISKLLLKPVTIAYKPSLQEFLSVIGLLDSADDAGDDDDDNDDNDNDSVAKRLRSIIEPVGAQGQCDQTIGNLRNNPGIRCYICGGRQTDVTMECEHIFCIGLAIEYFGLLRCSGLSDEEKLFLSILYAWAHRCCNRLKSNISFMKVNPNYKAPQAGGVQVPGRNNFFMFHEDNAAKLLSEIFSNNTQHDCGRIDKRGTKAQFVAARLPVVSANVLPLVNEANKGFGSVFAASTVLFTAMSCFKNTASLLVIQAVVRGSRQQQQPLTMNTNNMIDGFNSILPGVIAAAGGGSSRKKKNKYVGGGAAFSSPKMQQTVNVDEETVKNIMIEPNTIQIDELIAEEEAFYGGPQIHEEQNPGSINLRVDGSIEPAEKYSFLFKLTQITQSLNSLCLYSQLLLINENPVNQQNNISIFGTICNKYIQHIGNDGDYTLNELSVILLCQIAIYNNPIQFIHVTNFDVLNYIEDKWRTIREINNPFVQFVDGIASMYGLMSRNMINRQQVTPIRLHGEPYQYVLLRNSFMKLCLLQLNRYNECYDNASFKLNMNLVSDARQIVYEFIRDELFYFYCPFTPRPDEKLLQTGQFKDCLVAHGYLYFFEFMTDYASWMFIQYNRTYFRVYNLSANPDSQEDLPLKIGDTETSFPPPPAIVNSDQEKRYPFFILHPAVASMRHIDNLGPRKRTITVGNPEGGKSRKKNKHNITKKYKTMSRKSRQPRRNKHKHNHARTIKRRNSRRNNRN